MQNELVSNPFAKVALPSAVNLGSVAVEQERAVAQVQAAMVIAKRFPRDEAAAYQRAIDACRRTGLAEVAFYNFSRGGENISGPSIRLAEELARCWGNIEFGLNELSNRDGVSEMEAYCWDLETNNKSSQRFTVRHVRDTRNGPKSLNDQRDVYEMTANMGARRLRERILSVLPPDLVEGAKAECLKTLAGKSEVPLLDRVRAMVGRFEKVGVTLKMLENRLGHTMADTTPDELAEYFGIYQAIKDGVSKPSEYFSVAKPVDAIAAQLADLNAKAEAAPPPKATRTKAAAQAATAPVVEAQPVQDPAEAKESTTPSEVQQTAEQSSDVAANEAGDLF